MPRNNEGGDAAQLKDRAGMCRPSGNACGNEGCIGDGMLLNREDALGKVDICAERTAGMYKLVAGAEIRRKQETRIARRRPLRHRCGMVDPARRAPTPAAMHMSSAA